MPLFMPCPQAEIAKQVLPVFAPSHQAPVVKAFMVFDPYYQPAAIRLTPDLVRLPGFEHQRLYREHVLIALQRL